MFYFCSFYILRRKKLTSYFKVKGNFMIAALLQIFLLNPQSTQFEVQRLLEQVSDPCSSDVLLILRHLKEGLKN